MIWHPVDYIVAVLALGIAVALIVTTGVPLALHKPLSEERAKLLNSLAVALIAIIAMYVGHRIENIAQ